MNVLICITTVSVFVHTVVAGVSYSYENVADWNTLFPDSCGGSRQSPIDIDRNEAEYKAFDPLVLTGFDATTGVTQTLQNNGHTVQLSLEGSYSVSGGGLPSTYNVAQLHFHWGSDNTKGSEHTLDGYEFPAELHIVTVQDGLTLDDALLDANGLAVLGVYLEIGIADNAALAPITDAIENLVGDEALILNTTVVLLDLLPDTNNFFRYEGSLTTPTCNEAVIWTVFENTVKISENQLQTLRQLKDDGNNTLSDNYRPPQELNQRILYKSYSSATSVSVSLLVMMVAGGMIRLSM